MAYGDCHHLYHRTPYGDILIRINRHLNRRFYGDFTLTLHRDFNGDIFVPILYSNRIQDCMRQWLTTPDNAFHTVNFFINLHIYGYSHPDIV